jgi:single-stranded-DNA-specific exonuclease
VIAARRRWVLRDPEGGTDGLTDLEGCIAEAFPDLARSRRRLALLLSNRGLGRPEDAVAFLTSSLSAQVRSPLLMKDMRCATMRLADALRGKERIVVFADYDVDGISGAAELVLFFRELGVELGLYVPSRLREGYGLNEAAVRHLAAEGAQVIVTVDCGSANREELALASRLGMDVIVCDHHHVPTERPPALAVLNPHQADCSFPFKGLSGAGVVFYLLMGLRMELRARGLDMLPDLRRYLDLVALGTVADVMPLREENRVFVKYGLRELDRSVRPGVAALKEVAPVETASVRTIGFRLAPVLNAGGRVADARRSIDLLVSTDLAEARMTAARLRDDNVERREIEQRMVGEAIAMVEGDGSWTRRASIVVGSPAWHPGVVGIVAARLVDRYYRPSFVLAMGDTLTRGSGRSIAGLHLVETLEGCRDVLQGFGGHRAAAGLTMRTDDVPRFAATFEASVRARTDPGHFIPRLDVDEEVPFAAIDRQLVEDLRMLEPSGPGNPAPTFLSRAVEIVSRREVGVPDEQGGDVRRPHVKMLLRQGSAVVDAIGFRMSRLPIRQGSLIDVVFSPQPEDWGGRRGVSLRVIDMRPAGEGP